MYIKQIIADNLQSLQHEVIDLPPTGLVVFTGQNSNGKSIIVKNKALCDSCKKISSSVSKSYHTVTNKISTVYTNCMYKYNLRSIQKKQLKALQEGEKEVINKGNMSSVITESKIN